MKRCLFGLPLALLLIVGPIIGQERKPTLYTSPLFPLQVGSKWLYVGNEPKDRITVTVDRMEAVKRRATISGIDRSEAIETFILKTTTGDKSLLEQVMVTDDAIYRFATAGKEIVPPLKIMKTKPAVGDSWMCESLTENVTIKGQFVIEQEDVTLPKLGVVRAWVSKTRDFTVGDQKLEAAYWFAPNIGIVKQHLKVGKFEMRTTLEEFKPAAEAIPTLPGLPALPPTK